MNHFGKATNPVIKESERTPLRDTPKIPDAKEEELQEWIAVVVPDAPFEWADVAGVHFQKYYDDPRKSIPGNEGMRFPAKYIPYLLSKKQIEYLQKRADNQPKIIPRRTNRQTGEVTKAYTVWVGDYLKFSPVKEFNPIAFPQPEPIMEEEPPDTPEKVQEELNKKQAERGQEKKEGTKNQRKV